MKRQLIFILALGLAFATTQYAQHTGLTQTQILHLIEVHAPDELVAPQSRGSKLAISSSSRVDSKTPSRALPNLPTSVFPSLSAAWSTSCSRTKAAPSA